MKVMFKIMAVLFLLAYVFIMVQWVFAAPSINYLSRGHADSLYCPLDECGISINGSVNETFGNATYWKLDGTNAPPTAYWNMSNQGFTQMGPFSTPQSSFLYSFYDVDDDLIFNVTSVEGNNYFGIETDGAFMHMFSNPNPSVDYEMFTFSETQGDDTDIVFYEGGTTHNRLWVSGSTRIGGGRSSVCTNLTDAVDCDTPLTGADLVVQDDIWSGGKIFADDWSNVTHPWVWNDTDLDIINDSLSLDVDAQTFTFEAKVNSTDGIILRTPDSTTGTTADVVVDLGQPSGGVGGLSGDLQVWAHGNNLISGMSGISVGAPISFGSVTSNHDIQVDGYMATEQGLYIADTSHYITSPAVSRMEAHIERASNIGLFSIENDQVAGVSGSRYCANAGTCAQFVRFEGDDRIHAIYNAEFSYHLFENSAQRENMNFSYYSNPCVTALCDLTTEDLFKTYFWGESYQGDASHPLQVAVFSSERDIAINSLIFGELYNYSDNGEQVNFPAADTYVNLSNMTHGDSASMGGAVDNGAYKMKIRIPGTYKVDWSTTMIPTVNGNYGAAVMKNDSVLSDCQQENIGFNTFRSYVGGTCLHNFVEGDLIVVGVKNVGATNSVSVTKANLNVLRIGAPSDTPSEDDG